MGDKRKISIVVPVYNEDEALPELFVRLKAVADELKKKACEVEIIFNDNDSRDSSWLRICEFTATQKGVVAHRLSRNYGFQSSIQHGMAVASGDAVVVLQSDLQDPPELIPAMVDQWLKGSRTVACVILQRSERGLVNSLRSIFYGILRLVSDSDQVSGFQDFYLLDRRVVDELRGSPFGHQFLRGRIVASYGLDSRIFYCRDARKTGKTSFKLSEYYSLALDGLLINGQGLLRILGLGGLLASLFSLALFTAIVIAWALGYRTEFGGWMSLISLGLMTFSVLTLGFAFVSEYLIRIFSLLAVPVQVQVAEFQRHE